MLFVQGYVTIRWIVLAVFLVASAAYTAAEFPAIIEKDVLRVIRPSPPMSQGEAAIWEKLERMIVPDTSVFIED